MILLKERELICEYSRRMLSRGLTRGTGGNISILNRAEGLIAISPSGVEYDTMTAEDVPVIDLCGDLVEGHLKPSSEIAMHLSCYRARADVSAVVHTHSTFACTLACLGWELPPVHYLIGFAGDKVEVAPYHRFGTLELGEEAVKVMGERNAVLLQNHGLLAVGEDIARAFGTAEETEFTAEIYYRTRLAGDPILLSDEEMQGIIPLFREYGRQKELK